MSKVRIALVQMKSTTNLSRNLDRAHFMIDCAGRQRANIVCLGELFKTPYFCQAEETKNFDFAEKIPGPTTQFLSKVAREKKIVLIVPLFERSARGIYHNTAVVIDADGSLLGKYRKMHIPDDTFYLEKYYFTPGDLGFRVFDTRFGKIGVLICWDQWYPEAARMVALGGAEVLFFPTAIGSLSGRMTQVGRSEKKAWQTIQVSHAIANGFYVAAVNRVGKEKKLNFWGSSFIAGPNGELLARAGTRSEEIVYADCDLSKISQVRKEWPFLRDRRVDAYRPLVSP